ncbi:heat-inducible transcriptional repressor HrcA [Leptolyngbya sp. 'hensonii']|uniref:heat-inducible transcriptional repressor HrcA n=1 Tax=Leptolyngbya sp. 'hensonii' TaxID=1922337 RepID=UPI00094FF8CE|nr:heat-inducible transcriptional repressor HrcA [Leptolyngbya sp. 'hensonii']OLP16796.1 heat-inducible transcriptional repressor HrcA [Leptolyngbya sp. 'hensonii']
MPVKVNLNARQQHILWATVRHYIATAEPVGSKALVEEYNLTFSPATIRNAMGYLEKAGLLYQPHTSAGRIPSDSGYRIYVDQLISPATALAQQVEQQLSDRLSREGRSLESLLRGAVQILATLSGYVALITTPQSSTATLRHLQLILVDPDRAMLIAVLDSYETKSVLIELPKVADAEAPDTETLEREIQILSNFLNHQLRGKSLLELATMDWQDLDREFERYADFLSTLLRELTGLSQAATTTQIFISGVSEVLRHPEFSELHQFQAIVHLLEDEQDQLWPLMWSQRGGEPGDRRVSIRIGAENPLEPMRSCALVSTTYRRGSVPVGSVGMLGPTRMAYEQAIATVEAAADYLSEALS